MFARTTLLSVLVLASGLTVHQDQDPYEAMSKIKVPLKPILISCYLQDILIVSAPVIKSAQYFLSRPNGDTTRLNITRPTYHQNDIINDEYDNIIIKHEKHFQGIIPVSNYKVFDLLSENFSNVHTYEENTKGLNANDFVIGPLLQEDHGNWMLSAYYVDADGEWVEMYQVITIEITDYVPSYPRIADLKPGDTFSFSFAYPIRGLQSCELMAPKSTFDRFFERDDKIDLHRCGYVIRNVTRKDRGLWRITAVGRIVYLTQLTLEVLET